MFRFNSKFLLMLAFSVPFPTLALPTQFDLRNVGGKNWVTPVKNQSGGTCWTHGTMAAIEGNLMTTGVWAQNGETGPALLAEYHLDWWNGFNQNFNADIAPEKSGLTVHQGGDYRVAAAYLARGGGAVRKVDAQSFDKAPKQTDPNYHTYYVRDIEWFNAGAQLEQIDPIKQALMDNGVMGTALTWSDSYYSASSNTFYQPASSKSDPNHAVAIVGWDDNKKTRADKPGAWLIKNSWGTSWGSDGYFWISYYDKVAGHHPEMGAVSFKHTEKFHYQNIYYHDYHGWRATRTDVADAFNAFVAKGNPQGREVLSAVSFYTTADNVEYTVSVYKDFKNGQLGAHQSSTSSTLLHSGFHTVDLNFPVWLKTGDRFYVEVVLSQGGHAIDKTSNVPVLLGASARVTVKSTAAAGQSFYLKGNQSVASPRRTDGQFHHQSPHRISITYSYLIPHRCI